MFFVSQKILNCFMTVWTELCRFFNTCKCFFFFNHSSMVHPTFNTNFGTFCLSFSSLVFSKYLCMMPLSWMCLPKDYQNNSFWRRHSLVTLGVFVLLYNTIRVFFFTIESASVKILKVFDHIKFCEATDFSSFCCDIGLRKYSRHILRTVCTHFFSSMSVSFNKD